MKKILALMVAAVLLFAPAVVIRAQSGGPYTVTWTVALPRFNGQINWLHRARIWPQSQQG